MILMNIHTVFKIAIHYDITIRLRNAVCKHIFSGVQVFVKLFVCNQMGHKLIVLITPSYAIQFYWLLAAEF